MKFISYYRELNCAHLFKIYAALYESLSRHSQHPFHVTIKRSDGVWLTDLHFSKLSTLICCRKIWMRLAVNSDMTFSLPIVTQAIRKIIGARVSITATSTAGLKSVINFIKHCCGHTHMIKLSCEMQLSYQLFAYLVPIGYLSDRDLPTVRCLVTEC